MTRQNKISFIILFVGLGFLSFVVIQKALADVSNIKFPVAELGGCTSETECRSYCDKPENSSPRATKAPADAPAKILARHFAMTFPTLKNAFRLRSKTDLCRKKN